MKHGSGTPRDKDNENKPVESLRQRAEKRMGEKLEGLHLPVKKEDMQKIIHELQVHQIELEIQNEELVRARDEVEAVLERYTELYDFAPVGYFTLDRTGTIRNVNLTGATLLGLERSLVVDRRFQTFVRHDSPPVFNAFLKTVFEQKTRESYDMELKTRDDSPLVVRVDAHVTSAGQECFMAVADITARKHAEEELKKFSEDLERKVIDRTSEISDINQKLIAEVAVRLDTEKHLMESLRQKEILLREIHHRVKNNLQILVSLLNLQSSTITDERILTAIGDYQNRVRAMALVHEKLYRSTDIEKVDLEEYVTFLGNSLFQFYGIKGKGITFTMDIHDISVAIDTAIPLGLIINELLSNSLKHAFPDGRRGEITLAARREEHTLTILFKDNGAGIPSDFDVRDAKSLGLRLVFGLVEQISGTIELDGTAGTTFNIVVKEKE